MSVAIAKQQKKQVGYDKDGRTPIFEDIPEVVGLTLPKKPSERRAFIDGVKVPETQQERHKWNNSKAFLGGFPYEIQMPCGEWFTIMTREDALGINADIPCKCGDKNHFFVRVK